MDTVSMHRRRGVTGLGPNRVGPGTVRPAVLAPMPVCNLASNRRSGTVRMLPPSVPERNRDAVKERNTLKQDLQLLSGTTAERDQDTESGAAPLMKTPLNIQAADRLGNGTNSATQPHVAFRRQVPSQESENGKGTDQKERLTAGHYYVDAFVSAQVPHEVADPEKVDIGPRDPDEVFMTFVFMYSAVTLILQISSWIMCCLWPVALVFSTWFGGVNLQQGCCIALGMACLTELSRKSITCCVRSIAMMCGVSHKCVSEVLKAAVSLLNNGKMTSEVKEIENLQQDIVAESSADKERTSRGALLSQLYACACSCTLVWIADFMTQGLLQHGHWPVLVAAVVITKHLAIAAGMFAGIVSLLLFVQYCIDWGVPSL